jgi:branched-subunit amino acid transport protein
MTLNPFEIWLVIVLLLALVLLQRCGVLLLPRKYQPKGAFARALGFAPLAALVAICAPEIAKFQMEAVDTPTLQAASYVGAWWSRLEHDWRLWGALALVLTMQVSKNSKRAALYGLAAAAAVVWLL